MIEIHLRELERLLRCKLSQKELKTVDHFNNQPTFTAKNNLFLPAVFIDMGHIIWKPMVSDIFQQGTATITLHCVNESIRETKDIAGDEDGKRLRRFDWSRKIMDTMNGKAGKDKVGNSIFNRLQLTGSQFDTNHDSMYDDMLMFTCQVFYYNAWRECGWQEIILAAVDTPYDSTITL